MTPENTHAMQETLENYHRQVFLASSKFHCRSRSRLTRVLENETYRVELDLQHMLDIPLR
jgi:hypothetical protein